MLFITPSKARIFTVSATKERKNKQKYQISISLSDGKTQRQIVIIPKTPTVFLISSIEPRIEAIASPTELPIIGITLPDVSLMPFTAILSALMASPVFRLVSPTNSAELTERNTVTSFLKKLSALVKESELSKLRNTLTVRNIIIGSARKEAALSRREAKPSITEL